MYTTWTVDVTGSKYTPNNTYYFRTEEEADSCIVNLKYDLRAYGITDATITKDSHQWDVK